MLRSGSLLVGIAANEVLGIRGALDEVGDALEVDHLALGDIPLVHYEVDVEPDLGDVLDILDGLGIGEPVLEVVVGSVGIRKGLGKTVTLGKDCVVVVNLAGTAGSPPTKFVKAISET